jgi:hypothetical protein
LNTCTGGDGTLCSPACLRVRPSNDNITALHCTALHCPGRRVSEYQFHGCGLRAGCTVTALPPGPGETGVSSPAAGAALGRALHSLHCTAHCALRCTALHCTALHPALRRVSSFPQVYCPYLRADSSRHTLGDPALHCTALHCTALHCTALSIVDHDALAVLLV